VIRGNVPETAMTAEDAVRSHESLSGVERAFRSVKTVDLLRPIHHRTENRVRAHVFLCMLTYYVEWHMRQALSPLLFDDEARGDTELARRTVVARAERSEGARRRCPQDGPHRAILSDESLNPVGALGCRPAG
jgi:hypothetical protein